MSNTACTTNSSNHRSSRKLRLINRELFTFQPLKIGEKAEHIASLLNSGEINEAEAEDLLSTHIQVYLLAYIPGNGEEVVGNAIRNSITSVHNHKFDWDKASRAKGWLTTILSNERRNVFNMRDRWPSTVSMMSLDTIGYGNDYSAGIAGIEMISDTEQDAARVAKVMDECVPANRRVGRSERWEALRIGFFEHLPKSDSMKPITAKDATNVRKMVEEKHGSFYNALNAYIEGVSDDTNWDKVFYHMNVRDKNLLREIAQSLVSLGSSVCDEAFDCSLTSAYQQGEAYARRRVSIENKKLVGSL